MAVTEKEADEFITELLTKMLDSKPRERDGMELTKADEIVLATLAKKQLELARMLTKYCVESRFDREQSNVMIHEFNETLLTSVAAGYLSTARDFNVDNMPKYDENIMKKMYKACQRVLNEEVLGVDQ